MASSWFDKFLKLLGIEEQQPDSSSNAFSVTDKHAIVENKAVEVEEQKVQVVKQEKSVPETIAREETTVDISSEPVTESLSDVYPGLKANFIKVLSEAGFNTKTAIDKASDKELLALKGIGQATLKILRGK